MYNCEKDFRRKQEKQSARPGENRAGFLHEQTRTEKGSSCMPDPHMLRGYRRELTKDLFEELAALQCEPAEILGYIGTTRPKLESWCRRTYRRPLPEILEAVRQDGLIQIRRASFDQLKKSATIISQQYNRFLPPLKADEAAARAAIQALTEAVALPEEEIREVFD